MLKSFQLVSVYLMLDRFEFWLNPGSLVTLTEKCFFLLINCKLSYQDIFIAYFLFKYPHILVFQCIVRHLAELERPNSWTTVATEHAFIFKT